MSTEERDADHLGEGEEIVETNYQPPPQKSIEEIIAADQEDESLRKYKETLLGAAQTEKIIVGMLIKAYTNRSTKIILLCRPE